MKKASVTAPRYRFEKLEHSLRRGKEVNITKRGKILARLAPERMLGEAPDFLGRLRSIYGKKRLKVSGAELVEKDRGRY